MDTVTRRELLRRVARAAIVGPVILATREEQSFLLYRLAKLFGQDSAIGRWFWGLWARW